MKKGAIAFIGGLFVFVAVLALCTGVLALVGKVASGTQQTKAVQAQADIAHEQRLETEAEMEPEIIEEQWQGQTQYLLVAGQLEADRDMRRALIRLALADLNERQGRQGFVYAVATLVICFLIGLVWWQAATRAVQGGDQ